MNMRMGSRAVAGILMAIALLTLRFGEFLVVSIATLDNHHDFFTGILHFSYFKLQMGFVYDHAFQIDSIFNWLIHFVKLGGKICFSTGSGRDNCFILLCAGDQELGLQHHGCQEKSFHCLGFGLVYILYLLREVVYLLLERSVN